MKIIETNLKFNGNHTDRSGAPGGIVLHHAAASVCSVDDVHRWHLSNGWAGIGYHLFVRKDGSVYRGRPENWIGAHTSGYNDYIGVCCEGNFEEETMPAAQKNTVVEVLKYLYGKYGVLTVRRHRDLDSTACPGGNYPFDEIVKLSKQGNVPNKGVNRVLDFQKAAVSDGYKLSKYGADGIWGAETEGIAKQAQIGDNDSGALTKLMQKLLIENGFALSKYGADGVAGSETVQQIKAFQKKNGLNTDGICGINTWKKLLRV